MNEEKSLQEYKEQKGFFGWLKSKFAQIKERFSPEKKVEEPKEVNTEDGLPLEELYNIIGGYPNPEELKKDPSINGQEANGWNLTQEEKDKVEQGYEEIRNAHQDEAELSEEELDEIKAGMPLFDDQYDR